jgi:hypothetical protein
MARRSGLGRELGNVKSSQRTKKTTEIIMSQPSLPFYLGTWKELLDEELRSHPLTEPNPNPWKASLRNSSIEPRPLPWKAAVSSLVGAISLREVASAISDAQVKSDLNRQIDLVVREFIASCVPRPWPSPGPLAEFYPPSWVYSIASALAVMANALPEGGVRSEVIEVAARALQASFVSGAGARIKLPSDEEIEAMTALPSDFNECEVLCEDLQTIVEDLSFATGKWRRQLLARLAANRARRGALHCGHCLPA